MHECNNSNLIRSDEETESLTFQRKFVDDPSFLETLGDVRGKVILDLGCGGGYYTRKMCQLGARHVEGVDSWELMIGNAQKKEQVDPLGIQYHCYDVSSMPKLGEFDIVTATHLLHFAKTFEELSLMCQAIRSNLKAGGRLVALNCNPDHPLRPVETHWKYGVTVTPKEPLAEGARLSVDILNRSGEMIKGAFTNYFWNRNTYLYALRIVGFESIEIHDATVSEKGYRAKGSWFWNNYLKEPGVAIIEAQ
jgi:toxoflavin synthase